MLYDILIYIIDDFLIIGNNIGNVVGRKINDNEIVIGNDNNTTIRTHLDNKVDLGTSSYQFKDVYFSGKLYQNGIEFVGGGSSDALTGSSANLTGLKFQHDFGLFVDVTVRATKVGDVVTLNIPTFTLNTDNNTKNIASNLILNAKPFTPIGTTNKIGEIIKVSTGLAYCYLEYVAGDYSSWYFNIQKVDETAWTIGSKTIYPFSISYQTINTSVLIDEDIATALPNSVTAYTPPTAIMFSPASGSISVDINDNLEITFNETIVADTGNIEIYKGIGELKQTIQANDSSKVTVSNNKITIINTWIFENDTSYYITVSDTSFKDVDNKYYAGFNNNTTWNFTTVQANIASRS